MNTITIDDLSIHINFIPLLANWHFKQWGDLTGASTESDYKILLSKSISTSQFPLTLIATNEVNLLGSVNIVDCDMDIRSEFTPWLAQLYVTPSERNKGIGFSLVSAATARCKKLGFHSLYLYTSGTLSSYYKQIGWSVIENVYYKGKERTVMIIKLID